jgi:hypothetical protein
MASKDRWCEFEALSQGHTLGHRKAVENPAHGQAACDWVWTTPRFS